MAAAIRIADVVPRLGRDLRRLLGAKGCTAGVAAIEFGIIAPILAGALVCTIDLSLGVYCKMQAQNAAQAGAEYVLANIGTNKYAACTQFSASESSAIAAIVPTYRDAVSSRMFSAISASPDPDKFCGCPSVSGVTGKTYGPQPPTCASGVPAGTYVTVSATATYTTLLPYPMLDRSYTFTPKSTVRIQ